MRLALPLLGSQVLWRAAVCLHRCPSLSDRDLLSGLGERLCEPKVGEHEVVGVGEEDVLWLDVAVGVSEVVQMLDCT